MFCALVFLKRGLAPLPKLILRKPVINCAPINFYSTKLCDINTRGIHENMSSLQMKKRPLRKKKTSISEDAKPPGVFSVYAYATAEEYRLEQLINGLMKDDLYLPKKITSTQNETLADVVYVTAKYEVTNEPREIFFFREGSIVFWNCTELESSNVLSFVKKYELDSYSENLVLQEAEGMDYRYEAEG